MSTDSSDRDVMDALARYAPTPATVSREWTAARSASVLTAVAGRPDDRTDPLTEPAAYEIPLGLATAGPRRAGRPRRGWSRISPVVVSVAVLAVVAGIVVALVVPHGSGRDPALSRAQAGFELPTDLSTATLRDGQYSHRVDQQIDLDADGKPIPNSPDAMVNRNWISTSGDVLSVRTGSQNRCTHFPHQGDPSFEEPTRSFFASLPTAVDALDKYMRDHVSGSSSRDEAVFVAVGDALRTADGLASPRLRGAFVGVLARTPGVVIHEDQVDYLGRPAVRADFGDQQTRPGEIASLFFDPSTFQFLEERDGSNGQPHTYAGPSPAYDAAPASAADVNELTGAAYVDVMTTEEVVDRLPTINRTCTND